MSAVTPEQTVTSSVNDLDLDVAIQALEEVIRNHQVALYRLKEHRNLVKAPVSRLPDEVLEIVFHEFRHVDYWYRGEQWTFGSDEPQWPAWVRITHVCRRWRYLAISDPRLWTSVKDYSGIWIHKFLDRSSPMPIDITFNLKTHSYLVLIMSLPLHLSRIRSLCVKGPDDKISMFISHLNWPAPLLEDLNITRTDTFPSPDWAVFTLDDEIFCRHVPRLRDLHLSPDILFNENSPLASDTLENLYILSRVMTTDRLKRILRKTSNLRSLDYYNLSKVPEGMEVAEEDMGPIELPRLRSLDVHSVHPNLTGRGLSDLSVPSLRHLSAQVYIFEDWQANADDTFFLSMGWLMRQVTRTRGPLLSARLDMHHDDGQDTRKICVWPSTNQGLYFSIESPFPESPVGIFSANHSHQSVDLAQLHRILLHRLPFESLATLTIVMWDVHTSGEWVDILRPLQCLEMLKLEGTFPNLLQAVAHSISSDDHPEPEKEDHLFPNLAELIISRSRINAGGGRLLAPLRDVAQRRRSFGMTLRIAFEECTKYSQVIDRALVGIAEVKWDSVPVMFWDELGEEAGEEEDWLGFMHEKGVNG